MHQGQQIKNKTMTSNVHNTIAPLLEQEVAHSDNGFILEND